MDESEMTLRNLLWLRHGCDHTCLYGDDGEMQCNKCLIDFKRDPAEKIAERFHRIGLRKLEEHPLAGKVPDILLPD